MEFKNLSKQQETIKKFNINLEKLEKEQEKLAKNLVIKDSMNFDEADKFCGIDNIFFKNNIISAAVVINSNLEVIEQKYFSDRARFPYISGFRAYRELPAMISVFNSLEEKPDVVFIKGHGILHPRGLGIASHFSLAANISTIGIADSILTGEIKNNNIIIGKKIKGKVLEMKKGSNPLYISPGNLISVETAAKLTKKLITPPHKYPSPLMAAKKYAKEIFKSLYKV